MRPVPVTMLLAILAGAATAQLHDPFPAVFELSQLLPENGGDGSLGFVVQGTYAQAYLAYGASSIGDMNADGMDDFAIGVPQAFVDNVFEAGAAYVIFGRGPDEPFDPLLDLESLDGVRGFKIEGPPTYAHAGARIAGVGDFNADGIDDMAISASSLGADYEGAVYVIFGNCDGFPATLSVTELDGTNGFQLLGTTPDASLGKQLAGGGDLNADGISDLAIGEHYGFPFSYKDSRVHVIFGSQDTFPRSFTVDDLDGTNGFSVAGATKEQGLGAGIDMSGDINNDAIDDLLVGAPQTSIPHYVGSAYVIYGRSDGFQPNVDIADPDGIGVSRFDGFHRMWMGECGTSVSNAGDLNADSIRDFSVTDEDLDRVFVVYGRDGGFDPITDLFDLEDHDALVLDGPDLVGESKLIPDVNGDGIDDLLIGVRTHNDYVGSAAVVFGNAGKVEGGGSELLDGERGFRLLGFRPDSATGEFVGSAGDINSDGIKDFFVAAPVASPHELEYAGEAYIVFGRHQPCPADFTGTSDPNDPTYGVRDGDADADDFFFLLDAFANADLDTCDLDQDNDCDADDFAAYLDIFSAGCQ